jgi:hypothetical protein
MKRAKLSVEQVLEARLRNAAGERELAKLAKEYAVSRWAPRNPVLGLTFKHFPMPPRSA